MYRFVIAVAALVVVIAPPVAAAQQLGQVFVEVKSRSTGEPVLDLEPDAFEVTEDGRAAGVVSADLDAVPMKIALLIDNGDRVAAANALNPLRAGLLGFLDTLDPQHEISVMTIARSVQQQLDFTTDRAALREAVGLLFPDQGAGVRLLDGIRETWERRFEGDEAFPVMVLVLTDGTESSRHYNEQQYGDLIDTLISNGVTVHTVILASRWGVRAQQVLPQYAINITQNTGGVLENFVAPSGYEQVLPQLAERMNAHYGAVSTRYRLLFERPDPPGSQVSVTLAGSGLTFRLFIDRRMPQ